jgi:response regulator RpfG family c-di-GMP phosphodiesterase
MRESIKSITLKKLILFFIGSLVLLVFIIGYNFRELAISSIENKASTISKVVEASITSHMKDGSSIDNHYFFGEIQSIYDINKIKIVKNNNETEDKDIKDVFVSKEKKIVVNDMHNSLRAIIPLKADKNKKVNCLKCHNIENGGVIAVVDIELDVTESKLNSIEYLYIIIGVSILFLVLIVLNFFKVINSHVKKPLEELIISMKKSYNKHEDIDEAQEIFETLEFHEVVHKVNDLNHDILKKQVILEKQNEDLVKLNRQIEDTQKEVLFMMGVVAESRSKETAFHVKRVAEYSYLLARKYGLPKAEAEFLRDIAPMHDIGKVAVSDLVLNKPAKLDKDEFELMKEHTTIGYEILNSTDKEILKKASIVAYEHHEKWDGTGYPRGLKGEDIHIYGRIVAIADVFDALANDRCYKKAWPVEEILTYFKEQRGKQFDPNLIDIFFENLDEFLEIKNILNEEFVFES